MRSYFHDSLIIITKSMSQRSWEISRESAICTSGKHLSVFKSVLACRSQFIPANHVATSMIFEDNSKLGRECSRRTLSSRGRRREAVFSDRIDRRDSREFLKVTRAFHASPETCRSSRSMMRDRKKQKKNCDQLREIFDLKTQDAFTSERKLRTARFLALCRGNWFVQRANDRLGMKVRTSRKIESILRLTRVKVERKQL